MKPTGIILFYIITVLVFAGCKKEQSPPQSTAPTPHYSAKDIVGNWFTYEAWIYERKSDGTVCADSMTSYYLPVWLTLDSTGNYNFAYMAFPSPSTYSLNVYTGEIIINYPNKRMFYNVSGNPFDASLIFGTGTISPTIYWTQDLSTGVPNDCEYKHYLQYHFKKQ